MGTIMIINNSSFTEYSAVMRVGRLLAGDEYHALHDEHGNKVVSIKKQRSNSYLVIDAE
jgi:hypothetical protein